MKLFTCEKKIQCYLLSQTMRLFETLILFGFIWATTLGSKQPHIILMVADDLGNFPKKCNWCLPILKKTLVVVCM